MYYELFSFFDKIVNVIVALYIHVHVHKKDEIL